MLVVESFSMVSTFIYEVSIGLIGLGFSGVFLFYLDEARDWEFKKLFYKFSAALALLSVMILSQVVEESWNVLEVGGLTLPPPHVLFEAAVLAYLVTGLADLARLELAED